MHCILVLNALDPDTGGFSVPVFLGRVQPKWTLLTPDDVLGSTTPHVVHVMLVVGRKIEDADELRESIIPAIRRYCSAGPPTEFIVDSAQVAAAFDPDDDVDIDVTAALPLDHPNFIAVKRELERRDTYRAQIESLVKQRKPWPVARILDLQRALGIPALPSDLWWLLRNIGDLGYFQPGHVTRQTEPWLWRAPALVYRQEPTLVFCPADAMINKCSLYDPTKDEPEDRVHETGEMFECPLHSTDCVQGALRLWYRVEDGSALLVLQSDTHFGEIWCIGIVMAYSDYVTEIVPGYKPSEDDVPGVRPAARQLAAAVVQLLSAKNPFGFVRHV